MKVGTDELVPSPRLSGVGARGAVSVATAKCRGRKDIICMIHDVCKCDRCLLRGCMIFPPPRRVRFVVPSSHKEDTMECREKHELNR